MYEFINTYEFARYLFDREEQAQQAGSIMQAMLSARSPRISDLAQHMPGKPAANYKRIQRFLAQADPQRALLRLFDEEAPFVIGDPTEIPRPQASKTAYVGTLKDGQTRGFWLLMLATPYRGRALPFHFITYSSRTIAQEANSRNLEHFEAILGMKKLLGEKPIVLDREFSYGLLLDNLSAAGIHFVIRLRVGHQPPILLNAQGRRIELNIAQDGQPVRFHELYYQGRIAVNLMGVWEKGHRQPLWVMTSLAPDEGMQLYQSRVKIEESFRDLKDLLHLDKVMNKTQLNMEKMVALHLMTYAVGLLIGEAIRDQQYPLPDPASPKRKPWHLYSGLFVLLKQRIQLSTEVLYDLVRRVLLCFSKLVLGDVRTNV